MNIWFSSDFHYGHANICGPKISKWNKGYRNFDSIPQMNDAIVESLNSRIKENDVLYFLGDWAFGGRENIPLLRNRIQCKTINFVLGNHDQYIRDYSSLFNWVKPVWEGKIGGKYFVLNHYSQRIWNHSHHFSYHLYGHSHGTLSDDINSLSFDVGWDTKLFDHAHHTPYHIDEVTHIMENFKTHTPIDHHNKETH